jgi:predicted acylesterase/phospholipase RssA
VKKKTMVILADEIAPREEIDLGNELSPDHEKLRRTVADGCRATLETLYRQEIRTLRSGLPDLPCGDLLRSIAPRRAGVIGKCGGLKAVCDRCTGVLQYRPEQNPNEVQHGVLKTYGQNKAPDAKELTALFPQLAEEKPKVVFLGSGGVFRGAFHIGVLAAMHQTKLYPDLVIGASVGTLMGGALCRMTAGSQENALQALSELAALFVHVDEKVSLTLTLKSAAKQLGIRAYEVRLSPSELARKVRRGSKADAGYAATGAPPVLTDALSYLFTIPHRNTAAITSQFVAGHFSEAVVRFLREVRRETLPSFDIQKCVMGVSLLEEEARTLLAFSTKGDELNTVQPYQGATPSGRKVAFFGTTSFLNGSSSLLLGRDFLTSVRSWDATQGSLCSSAFPAVFAPRMEADLMPGAGRTDRYFADGGMFDNLPFFPALEVLGAVQHGIPFTDADDLQEKLAKRAVGPNLIISAGLNEEPAPDANVQLDTMFAIKARATTLSYQSKTDTFTKAAGKAVAMLEEISSKDLSDLSDQQRDFLNGFVAGTVVGITPTDAAHINPTFAFCKSLGLRSKRVQASIGDGCYRSLLQFSQDRHVKNKLQTIGSGVTRAGVEDRDKACAAQLCPYFEIGGKPFECPFAQTKHPDARAVYDVCSHDPAHP